MAEQHNPEPSPSRTQESLIPAPSRGMRSHAPHRAHAAGPDAAANNMKPAFFWWVFRQWWMVLLPTSLLLAGVATAAIMFTYKPDYKASALIVIEDSRPYIAYSGADASTSTARYVETQVELLKSTVVLEKLLGIPEIANYEELATSTDRLGHLQKNLTLTHVGQSEMYQVGYVSKSPIHSATVANAVITEYLKIQDEDERDRTQLFIDLLEKERINRKGVVEGLRQEVVEISKEVTGRDPFGGATLDIEIAGSPFASIYHEFNQVEVDLEVRQAELQSIQETSVGSVQRGEKSGRLDQEVASHPAVLEQEASIKEITSLIEAPSQYLNPEEDESRRKLVLELERQQQALEKLKTELRARLVTELHDQDRANQEEATLRLERDIAALVTRKDLLGKKYKDELAKAQSGTSRSVELTFKEAELQREEKILELIEGRKLALQTESEAPARVKVRQAASVPVLPLTKAPIKILIMACAACFAAPFGLAVLRETSIRRISDIEQLSREAAVRVIGEVSHFPIRRAAANAQSLPPRMRRQMFVYLESIDALRTNLFIAEPKATSRVLCVTSAAAGEGKTCLATSLAASISSAEKRPVLIIDGDMRSPDVATVLGTRDRPGLAELLASKAPLSEVVQRVGKSNTYVIAAGRLKGNPHHLVTEERVTALVAQLRGQFPTVIIDTPPIFGGSESLVFAKSADSVVVSVMRDVSRAKQIGHAVDRLHRAGATVSGAVLNGTSSASYAYSYGYGYGYQASSYLEPRDA